MAKWRVLSTDIAIKNPARLRVVVKTCCLLHNMLRQQLLAHHIPAGYIDYEDVTVHGPVDIALTPGNWRSEIEDLIPMTPMTGTNVSNQAKTVREQYTNYFSSEQGSVSWQLSRVTNTGRKRRHEETAVQ